MSDLWTDYDPDFYLTSAELDEMERDDRTADEREQERQDNLDAEINRSMEDR